MGWRHRPCGNISQDKNKALPTVAIGVPFVVQLNP